VLRVVQGFRLGGTVQSKAQASRQAQEQAAAVVNKSLLSIDYASEYAFKTQYVDTHYAAENNEISDYLQEGDAGFKKPKVYPSFALPIFRRSLACRRRRSGHLVACPKHRHQMRTAWLSTLNLLLLHLVT
jgi:hypothetical protein